MNESPECFRCGSILVGASTPRGGTALDKPFPDRSTGYCAICHIGLTKTDGLWAATPTALSQ